jgi:hypothetical protein
MSSGKSLESGRSWERLDGVDLLPGLAVFLVLMNHTNIRLLSPDAFWGKLWRGSVRNRSLGFCASDGETGPASWDRRLRGSEVHRLARVRDFIAALEASPPKGRDEIAAPHNRILRQSPYLRVDFVVDGQVVP